MFFVSDTSDLIGVKKAQQIKYMRLLRWSLLKLGAWPQKEIGEVMTRRSFYYKCYIFLIELICILPGLLYLRNNIGKISFFELGHTYITVFMNIVAITRLTLIFQKKYMVLVGDFINKIHLFNHREKSDLALKIHILIHKLSHFFTIYIHFLVVMGILLFNATPFYKNVSSGALLHHTGQNVTFEHSVYYYLPFDYIHNFKGFLVIFIFNWYISSICAPCVCLFDLLLSLMVFHVWGHLKILIYNLEHFPKPQVKDNQSSSQGLDAIMFSPEEMKMVSKTLKDYIVYHREITQFLSRMSDIFGLNLFVYLAFHQVSGCLLLLECSQMDTEALARYGPLTLIMFQQIIQISIVFELISTMGDKLVEAVYSVPWECMDTSSRKILFIFLKQCQLPLSLKAMGMVQVGVQTTTGILRTSFSYFIMLRTTATANPD